MDLGKLHEKDITLDIARQLRGLLQAQPNINVLLTRDDREEVFVRDVGLDTRTAAVLTDYGGRAVSEYAATAKCDWRSAAICTHGRRSGSDRSPR